MASADSAHANAVPKSLQQNFLQSPRTLYNICLRFVAEHAYDLESIVGFPELIVAELFDAIKNTTTLLRDPTDVRAQTILRLFDAAYGWSLLSSLSLNAELRGVFCFRNLERLDISGITITEDMNTFVANLSKLSELYMRNCSLCDDDLRKQTAVLAMYDRGPKHLKVIDLADNPDVTDRGARFLCRFSYLEAANLSGTNISQDGIARMKTKLKLSQSERGSVYFSNQPIACVGWAADLVRDWLNTDLKIDDDSSSKNPSVLHFYGKPAMRMVTTSAARSFCRPVNTSTSSTTSCQSHATTDKSQITQSLVLIRKNSQHLCDLTATTHIKSQHSSHFSMNRTDQLKDLDHFTNSNAGQSQNADFSSNNRASESDMTCHSVIASVSQSEHADYSLINVTGQSQNACLSVITRAVQSDRLDHCLYNYYQPSLAHLEDITSGSVNTETSGSKIKKQRTICRRLDNSCKTISAGKDNIYRTTGKGLNIDDKAMSAVEGNIYCTNSRSAGQDNKDRTLSTGVKPSRLWSVMNSNSWGW